MGPRHWFYRYIYSKISPYLNELYRTYSINKELSFCLDTVRGGHLPGQYLQLSGAPRKHDMSKLSVLITPLNIVNIGVCGKTGSYKTNCNFRYFAHI